MTIAQTVEIPDDRRLIIDVPREIPVRAIASFELVWPPKTEKANDLKASIKRVRELCKDAPISVESFREMRRQEYELEENKYRLTLLTPLTR